MATLLVLGGTSGIARAVAQEFARMGWGLQLAGRAPERLQAVAQELMAFGVPVSCHVFDALDPLSRTTLWDSLPVCPDAVLCAVGYLGDQRAAQSDEELAQTVFTCNFIGLTGILTQAANSFAAQGRGLIIGVCSVAGDRGRASNYVYGAAKAGFAAYLQGLRNRLHPCGVRVLTVKPGYVSTPMLADHQPPALLTASPQRVARDIVRAVRRGAEVLYTPGWWYWILFAYRLLPEGLAKRLPL